MVYYVLNWLWECYYLVLVGITTVILLLIVLWPRGRQLLTLKRQDLVIVMGGCMGIGKQMLVLLARNHPSRLMLIDRKKDLFPALIEEIEQYGVELICIQCDLSNVRSVNEMLEGIKGRGQIRLLIYNAGIVIPKDCLQLPDIQHRALMEVNYFTPVRVLQTLHSQLQGGHYAVVASMVTVMEMGTQLGSYLASKRALFGFMSCTRQEFLRAKVPIVLSIGCPYLINTTMFMGFKTRIDSFMPCLKEQFAAEKLLQGFLQGQAVIWLREWQVYVFRILHFLPAELTDWAGLQIDQCDFSAIRNKHD